MVINAIEIKLLMVKTVAKCVKTKINQIFPPTTILCMSYEVYMMAMSAIEIRSRQNDKTG